MTYSIAIIDDHSLILEGLRSLLKDLPDVTEILEAYNGTEVLALMKDKEFQACIVDLDLPDIDGFALIDAIKKEKPDTKIIVCTMHEEVWIVNRLKHPSISGVVFKSSASEHIQEAVQQVINDGTSYYCPHFKKLYKEKQANTANMINQPPTTRELDILKSIAKGMNTHEISEHLFISENTVEWHRKNLMLKFGARNATDLVIKALAKGFLSIPLE